MVMDDLKAIIAELEQEESLPLITVELVDNELALIQENCNRSQVILLLLSRILTSVLICICPCNQPLFMEHVTQSLAGCSDQKVDKDGNASRGRCPVKYQ